MYIINRMIRTDNCCLVIRAKLCSIDQESPSDVRSDTWHLASGMAFGVQAFWNPPPPSPRMPACPEACNSILHRAHRAPRQTARHSPRDPKACRNLSEALKSIAVAEFVKGACSPPAPEKDPKPSSLIPKPELHPKP